MTESSSEKFRRLAEARVVRAIKDIRLIGNLSNRSNYSYDRNAIDKIFRTLEKELKQVRARFEDGGQEEKIKFSLGDE